MMTAVEDDFRGRVSEIEAYLKFIVDVDDGAVRLTRERGNEAAYGSRVKDDLLRTFNSSTILLLYNLMESTVSNAVEAVFDELVSQGISFDECRDELRKVILGNLKKHNIGSIFPKLNELSRDIIGKTFQKENLVSGNVDARKIRELVDEYGIERPGVDGEALLTVKTNRNDLAHGVKSFAAVGREFSKPDIVRLKEQVIADLTAMLEKVTIYISERHYLKAI
ncbi:MAG: hypothetical protein ACJA1W_001013 [Akkermansiaceae bacterium]|jgi:hypothetical protein